MTAVANLRKLIASGEFIVCPGVHDGISTRCALQHSPQALYATGAGMTASRCGLPDLAFATQDDFVAQAGMIASCDRSVPVIADGETGFGAATQIARTVERYIQAGIAGLHIEDQVQTKRCGHLAGKVLVTAEEFNARIRAASIGRKRSGGDIVIIARTDAFQSFGLEESIKRLKGAIEAGADVAFFEGVRTKEDAKKVAEALAPTPMLLNMVQGGDSPDWTVSEMQEMGASIGIYPTVGMFAAMEACSAAYAYLKQNQIYTQSPLKIRDFFNTLGLQEAMALDKASGGSLYTNGA